MDESNWMLCDENKTIRDDLELGQPPGLCYNHQKWTRIDFVTQDLYLRELLTHLFAL